MNKLAIHNRPISKLAFARFLSRFCVIQESTDKLSERNLATRRVGFAWKNY